MEGELRGGKVWNGTAALGTDGEKATGGRVLQVPGGASGFGVQLVSRAQGPGALLSQWSLLGAGLLS